MIDTHHHLWDLSVRPQPWLEGDQAWATAEELAPLRRSFTMADLEAAAPPAGVTGTVVVQVLFDPAETADMLAIADADGLVRAVVGWADLTSPDVGDQIAAYRELPGGDRLAGIRHPLLAEPDPEWLGRSSVRRGLRELAAAGLSFDLTLTARQLPLAVAAARAVPGLSFVLSHLGNPGVEGGDGVDPAWAAAIGDLGRLDNVVCKLSGAHTDPVSATALRPHYEVALAAFGPSRLMFGSDWPVSVLTAPYGEIAGMYRELIAGLSGAERNAILDGTARRVYGLRAQRLPATAGSGAKLSKPDRIKQNGQFIFCLGWGHHRTAAAFCRGGKAAELMGATLHAGRLTRKRTAVLALGLAAVAGLLLPGPGRALAAAPPGGPSSLSAGGPVCAIEAGKAYCWAPGGVPAAVNTQGVLNGKTLSQISTGLGYACALDTSGTAYCWGSNLFGQLGFGVLRSSVVPVPVNTKGVLAGKKLVQISAAEQEACALDSTGHAYCWGFGSLGDGSTAGSHVPVAVNTSGALAGKTLTQITTGNAYACALDTTGAAYCWGSGRAGQLGDASDADSSVPVPVDASGVLAGKKLVRISASELGSSTCAVDADGAAYCWGDNLGDGTANDSQVPVAVDSSGVLAGKTLTQIAAGTDATCALDSNGAAYCWGANNDGELGDNSRTNSTVPVAVDTSGALAGQTLTQIAAGDFALTCVMSTPGAVYCWGASTTSASSTVPVAAGPSPVTAVTAASGNRAAKVSWKVPVMSAGVTGYTAIAKPGEIICITKSTSCTIGGLTNDVTYSVTVVAHTATTNSSAGVPVAVTPGSKVVFTSNPFATAAFGTRFGFTVRAAGGSPAISIKGTLPPGVTFTRHAGGIATLAGTPDRGAVGRYHLTFTAKSKAGIATQGFILTVDRAPRLGKLPGTLTLKLRQRVSIPITTTGYPVAQLLKTGHLPSALPLLDHGNGTGLISGRVGPYDKPGRYQLTVIAANSAGDATHTITVLLVQAPAITSPRTAKVAIGNTFNFHVTGTGFPVPKITESGRLPKGVTFNSATATLKGIPRSGTKGSYKITFTAANSAGKVTQAFTLTVT